MNHSKSGKTTIWKLDDSIVENNAWNVFVRTFEDFQTHREFLAKQLDPGPWSWMQCIERATCALAQLREREQAQTPCGNRGTPSAQTQESSCPARGE